jgi:hypothetical protein
MDCDRPISLAHTVPRFAGLVHGTFWPFRRGHSTDALARCRNRLDPPLNEQNDASKMKQNIC